jgi:hypothetical protein
MTQGVQRHRPIWIAGLLAVLAACARPLPAPPPPPRIAPAAQWAAVRAAGVAADNELTLTPLADPQVGDLRQRAARAMQAQDPASAQRLLDQALALDADDPALLQERAEAALLAGDEAAAAGFAERAIALGSSTGPLCRRHWETLRQVQLAAGDEAIAAEDARHRDACTVGALPRY